MDQSLNRRIFVDYIWVNLHHDTGLVNMFATIKRQVITTYKGSLWLAQMRSFCGPIVGRTGEYEEMPSWSDLMIT